MRQWYLILDSWDVLFREKSIRGNGPREIPFCRPWPSAGIFLRLPPLPHHPFGGFISQPSGTRRDRLTLGYTSPAQMDGPGSSSTIQRPPVAGMRIGWWGFRLAFSGLNRMLDCFSLQNKCILNGGEKKVYQQMCCLMLNWHHTELGRILVYFLRLLYMTELQSPPHPHLWN